MNTVVKVSICIAGYSIINLELILIPFNNLVILAQLYILKKIDNNPGMFRR